MPSAKSHRAQVRKAAINKSARSYTRSRVNKARGTITTGGSSEEAASAVKDAVSALDRAARKGIIHPNEAARKKSRLQRHLNQISAS